MSGEYARGKSRWGMIAFFQTLCFRILLKFSCRWVFHCMCVGSFVLSEDNTSVSNKWVIFSLAHYSASAWMARDTTDQRLKLETVWGLTRQLSELLCHAQQSNFLKAGFAVLYDFVAVKTWSWPGLKSRQDSLLCFQHPACHIHFFLWVSRAIIPNLYPALSMAALVCMAV